jgi:hypothetical protein
MRHAKAYLFKVELNRKKKVRRSLYTGVKGYVFNAGEYKYVR